MEGIANQDGIFEKFFYEQEFNPIALYEIEPDIDNRGSGAIRYIDVNHAYEVVNKVKREDVVGKTFGEVWPYVESCWSEIIERCVRENCAVHCESDSVYTDKYLEAIAFPLPHGKAATIFLDRTELKKSEEELKEKQKKLLEYRSMLRELATQLTISEETTRREIATDLHDSIGHSLLALMLDLRRLKEIYKGEGEAGRIIDNSIKSTEEMITESRALIFELSPPILLEVGITPALEALADKLLIPRGIKWYVTTRGTLKDYPADDAVLHNTLPHVARGAHKRHKAREGQVRTHKRQPRAEQDTGRHRGRRRRNESVARGKTRAQGGARPLQHKGEAAAHRGRPAHNFKRIGDYRLHARAAQTARE